MFKQRDQKEFIKFEGARKLPQDLPHTIQEEQEHRRFTPRLPIRVRRLGTALLERVTCLHAKRKEKTDYGEERAGNILRAAYARSFQQSLLPAATHAPRGPGSHGLSCSLDPR